MQLCVCGSALLQYIEPAVPQCNSLILLDRRQLLLSLVSHVAIHQRAARDVREQREHDDEGVAVGEVHVVGQTDGKHLDLRLISMQRCKPAAYIVVVDVTQPLQRCHNFAGDASRVKNGEQRVSHPQQRVWYSIPLIARIENISRDLNQCPAVHVERFIALNSRAAYLRTVSFSPKPSCAGGARWATPHTIATRENTSCMSTRRSGETANPPCKNVVATGERTIPKAACRISITAAVCTTLSRKPTSWYILELAMRSNHSSIENARLRVRVHYGLRCNDQHSSPSSSTS